MYRPFTLDATPLPPGEMISILESGSPELDEYLGKEIYVKTDRQYLAEQRRRFVQTVAYHRSRVGDKPTILLRAPGRLNAFLEYLDMCDGDHMSTTIDGDIPLAISIRDDDVLNVGNTNTLFPAQQLSITDEFKRFADVSWHSLNTELEDNWDNRSLLLPHHGREQGDWLNYVLSNYMRVLYDNPQLKLRGADITFGPATVPFRAGTSSSSAVVVLSFLTLFLANRDILPPWTVTEVCKLLGEAEWYVGTHGGANDQMTILLNAANSVSYNRHSQKELSATPLPFLRGVNVVLANSLWEVNKSAGGNQSFNMRKGWMQMGDELMKLIIAAVQQAIANGEEKGEGWLGKLIDNKFGFTADRPLALLERNISYWEKIAAKYKKLGSLHEEILGIPSAAIEELILLLPIKITPVEAAEILGKHVRAIERIYTKPKRDIGGYHIRTTARFFYKQNIIGRTLEHIFLEAEARVNAGEITPESTEYDLYRLKVGKLVDDLQDSLSIDFRVSNPQLDLLLSIAKRGPGYLGGKLTGAGKGGCVSLLVREADSLAMCAYLDEEYYGKPEHFEFYRQVLIDDMRFSEPGSKGYESGRERMDILKHSLANIPDQRRVITFGRGACAVKLRDYGEGGRP